MASPSSLSLLSVANGSVTAILGPTNTGKTHLALERMMAHSSGIIGFPLRLLARENYDRMVKQKGEKYVALITGEEKIIPPQAKWFSCTVEAMPVDQQVDFLAIDEIQLCADPDRGHIFTDRLLHARGRSETLLLGAETIKPLLIRLIPHIKIETRPRLSQLIYAGHSKLSQLPTRSAIVAFSMTEVYAIAELIRRRKGGCAVVMGRLSPRTRNAQVALYQNREVDFLVATDAIGMGLNMDVSHVAFASTNKFDGTHMRPLHAAEMAQIAGRAGRGMKDGTFGLTGTCPPLKADVIESIETHHFPTLQHIYWRNRALDFSSPSHLLDSLTLSPPSGKGLITGHPGSDLLALNTLIDEEEIKKTAQNTTLTRLLWDSCQIPDFRKLGEDSHARLCLQIYTFLKNHGEIPTFWLERHIKTLQSTTGDMDTLMQRLATIRIFAYIAARKGWVKHATHWQNRTREIEDKLSDALHERLTSRFVDKTATALIRRLDDQDNTDLLAAITPDGHVMVEGHPIGHMHGFTFEPDPYIDKHSKQLMLRAARRALRQEMPYRVKKIADSDDSDFKIDFSTKHILWRQQKVAHLTKGEELLTPHIALIDSEFLTVSSKEAILKRLHLFLERKITHTLSPLFHLKEFARDKAILRGLTHQLYENGGWLPYHTAMLGKNISYKTHTHKTPLSMNEFGFYLPALFKRDSLELRLLLWALWLDVPFPDHAPFSSVTIKANHPAGSLLQKLGWIKAGPYLVRIDKAGYIASSLKKRLKQKLFTINNTWISQQLHIRKEDIELLLQGLGITLLFPPKLGPHFIGPPPPILLAHVPTGAKKKKNRPHKQKKKINRANHPFEKLKEIFSPPSSTPR